jgi:hypothetical protein
LREGRWGTHPGLLVEVEPVQGDVAGASEDLLDVRILALQHLKRGLILDLLVKQRLLPSRPHVDRSLRALGRPTLSSTMAIRALVRSTEDSRRALVRSPSDDGVVLARVVL